MTRTIPIFGLCAALVLSACDTSSTTGVEASLDEAAFQELALVAAIVAVVGLLVGAAYFVWRLRRD